MPAFSRGKTSCQPPAMLNGRCCMHGGRARGAPKGNCITLKHGRYTAAAVSHSRDLKALMKEMKALIEAVDAEER